MVKLILFIQKTFMKKKFYSVLAALILIGFVASIFCCGLIYIKLQPRAMVGNVRFFIPFFFTITAMLCFHWSVDFVYHNLAKIKIIPEIIFFGKFCGYVIIGQSFTAMIWGPSWWFLILSLVVGIVGILFEIMPDLFKEGN